MKRLPPASVDAVVTDPPYGLRFMGKEWDDQGVGVQQAEWHRRWAIEAFRVLKPGGHLLAFGGSRTYHHLATAVEVAEFEIRDQIMWLYGSGFPKSHDVSKAIEKVGEPDKQWDGWGTALKPAHEPIVVARKPLVGTVAANTLEYGTGGINIDGGRVATSETITNHSRSAGAAASKGKYGDSKEQATHQTDGQTLGRWPANVILDEEAGRILDKQSGVSTSGAAGSKGASGFADGYDGGYSVPYGDTGGASRFFYCAKPNKNERNAGLDTNPHPTIKPITLMRYLCRLVTPRDGLVLDPFVGSGTTGIAAVLEGFSFLGFEQDHEYAEIARVRVAHHLRDQQFDLGIT
jgi:site-specific DNA-methyltransferase (adenine-specific)